MRRKENAKERYKYRLHGISRPMHRAVSTDVKMAHNCDNYKERVDM